MNRFRRPQGLTIWPLLLALVSAAGCARPTGSQRDDGAAPADQHQVPFHDVAGTPARQIDSSTAQDNTNNPESDLPFHDPQNLPAGTLLTIRLKSPISAENRDAKGTFEAVVDEAVVVEGNKLVPRGASVSGRVELARASNVGRNRGYGHSPGKRPSADFSSNRTGLRCGQPTDSNHSLKSLHENFRRLRDENLGDFVPSLCPQSTSHPDPKTPPPEVFHRKIGTNILRSSSLLG